MHSRDGSFLHARVLLSVCWHPRAHPNIMHHDPPADTLTKRLSKIYMYITCCFLYSLCPRSSTPPQPNQQLQEEPVEQIKEWQNTDSEKVHLPDKLSSSQEKEEKRKNDRKLHEAKLREVRGERKIEKRHSLIKKKGKKGVRRVVVVEDKVKPDEPAKLVNPLLEQVSQRCFQYILIL